MSQGTNFNAPILKHCHLIKGEPNYVMLGYKVPLEHTNPYGTLHGGMSATLVDIVSSMAIVDHQEESLGKLGVSVDMNISYLNGAKAGEQLLIEGRASKIGKTLAFLECEIKSKDTNKIVVKGTHTKFIG